MTIPHNSRHTRLLSSVALGLASALLIVLVRAAGYLEPLELLAYDFLQSAKVRGSESDGAIALVTVTEDDIRRLGAWPLSDSLLASLLDKVEDHDPAVIGLDIYRDIPVPPGSRQLIETLGRHRNIVTVRKLGDDSGRGVPKPHAVRTDENVAFNDIVVDKDGTVRRGLLFLDDGEGVVPSFSFLLAANYLAGRGIVPEQGSPNREHLRLGVTTFVPLRGDVGGYRGVDARGYQYLLDPKGSPFPAYRLTEVLGGTVPRDAMAGKIVIIGSAAQSIRDDFSTPLSRFSGGRITYGVELHGMMARQLLRAAAGAGRPLTSWAEYQKWVWIICWGIIGTAMGLGVRSMGLFVGALCGSLCVLGGLAYGAFYAGWWIPVVPPALSCLMAAAGVTSYLSYRERADRKVLMQLFSKHVSKDVADALWDQRDRFMSAGKPVPQKLTATVLFSDLRGFTAISEKLEPQALMEWLNEYMEAMAEIIISHGGVINKYIGDSIMAVFGVPIARITLPDQQRDAVRAVGCALEMAEGLSRLNARWQEGGLPSAGMRIGIFTGPLVAGCLGSEQRMEYTVIGDTVNIASRLESYGKDEASGDVGPSCRILIGDDTLQCVGEEFVTAPVGEVPLKGREGKIGIHLVRGVKEE